MHRRLARPRRTALPARTHTPQKLPRINAQFMPIVPFEFQRVPAHRLRGNRLSGGLEHDQFSRPDLRRFPWLASSLTAFFVAQGARAGIAQEGKRVMGKMPILPLDFHPGPRLELNFDGLGVGGRHGFQYRRSRRWSFDVGRWPGPNTSATCPRACDRRASRDLSLVFSALSACSAVNAFAVAPTRQNRQNSLKSIVSTSSTQPIRSSHGTNLRDLRQRAAIWE
jgi:hypothetical protein